MFIADDLFLVRFPVLNSSMTESLSSTSAEELPGLVRKALKDKRVREAIYLASPSMYTRLKRWEAGGGGFNEIPRKIARYLTRMSYRATPFGGFSAVGACSRADQTHLFLPTAAQLKRLVQLDGRVLARIAAKYGSSNKFPLTLNDTIVTSRNSAAFLSFVSDINGRRIFSRTELEADDHLLFVLDIAKQPSKIDALVHKMVERFPEHSSTEVFSYIQQLVDAQLLCRDYLLDLTSDDVLESIATHVATHDDDSYAIDNVKECLSRIDQHGEIEPELHYENISEALRQMLGGEHRFTHVVKCDLFAPSDSPQLTIDSSVVAKIEQAVNKLIKFQPPIGPLKDFILKFELRWGDAEVPLSQVVDALELLGFRNPSQRTELAKQVRPRHASTSSVSNKAALENTLSNELCARDDLYLNIDDVGDLPDAQASEAQLVAWVALWRDSENEHAPPTVEITSVGVQAPGRLMGRFSYGIDDVKTYLRGMQGECGDTITAEIVHIPQDGLVNVSSRPRLTRYEFRIRSSSLSRADELSLSDLFVSVRGGEVVVTSRSLKKRVNFVMSNAHTFDASYNAPIYRFVCSLCNQHPRAVWPSTRRILPNARYAPGLVYDDIIVSRPSWKLSCRDLDRRSGSQDPIQRRKVLRALLADLHVPKWFSIVDADNSIPLNSDCDWMIDDLAKEVSSNDNVVLTEVFPRGLVPYASSSSAPHFHEILIPLRSDQQRNVTEATFFDVLPDPSVSPIFGEWVCIKIPCAAHHQNQALFEILPSLEEAIDSKHWSSFFFVRFIDQDGPHIRLRLKRARHNIGFPELPASLRSALLELSERSLTGHATVVPYIREVSRYGGEENCEVCEDIFYMDSQSVLNSLPRLGNDSDAVWARLVTAIDLLLSALGVETDESKLLFAERSCHDFRREMLFSLEERARIKKIYDCHIRPIKSFGSFSSEDPFLESFRLCHSSISTAWERSRPSAVRTNGLPDNYHVIWSIVHMRINRLMPAEQRLIEATIWELLRKRYASAKFAH